MFDAVLAAAKWYDRYVICSTCCSNWLSTIGILSLHCQYWFWVKLPYTLRRAPKGACNGLQKGAQYVEQKGAECTMIYYQYHPYMVLYWFFCLKWLSPDQIDELEHGIWIFLIGRPDKYYARCRSEWNELLSIFHGQGRFSSKVVPRRNFRSELSIDLAYSRLYDEFIGSYVLRFLKMLWSSLLLLSSVFVIFVVGLALTQFPNLGVDAVRDIGDLSLEWTQHTHDMPSTVIEFVPFPTSFVIVSLVGLLTLTTISKWSPAREWTMCLLHFVVDVILMCVVYCIGSVQGVLHVCNKGKRNWGDEKKQTKRAVWRQKKQTGHPRSSQHAISTCSLSAHCGCDDVWENCESNPGNYECKGNPNMGAKSCARSPKYGGKIMCKECFKKECWIENDGSRHDFCGITCARKWKVKNLDSVTRSSAEKDLLVQSTKMSVDRGQEYRPRRRLSAKTDDIGICGGDHGTVNSNGTVTSDIEQTFTNGTVYSGYSPSLVRSTHEEEEEEKHDENPELVDESPLCEQFGEDDEDESMPTLETDDEDDEDDLDNSDSGSDDEDDSKGYKINLESQKEMSDATRIKWDWFNYQFWIQYVLAGGNVGRDEHYLEASVPGTSEYTIYGRICGVTQFLNVHRMCQELTTWCMLSVSTAKYLPRCKKCGVGMKPQISRKKRAPASQGSVYYACVETNNTDWPATGSHSDTCSGGFHFWATDYWSYLYRLWLRSREMRVYIDETYSTCTVGEAMDKISVRSGASAAESCELDEHVPEDKEIKNELDALVNGAHEEFSTLAVSDPQTPQRPTSSSKAMSTAIKYRSTLGKKELFVFSAMSCVGETEASNLTRLVQMEVSSWWYNAIAVLLVVVGLVVLNRSRLWSAIAWLYSTINS